MTCDYVFTLLAYWASAHPSFSGYGDVDNDTLWDDHLDALGYDPEFVGWDNDSDA